METEMKSRHLMALVAAAVSAGDQKQIDFLREHHGNRKGRRPPKALRMKQVNEALYLELRAARFGRQVANELYRCGQTGKQMRKDRKKLLKARFAR